MLLFINSVTNDILLKHLYTDIYFILTFRKRLMKNILLIILIAFAFNYTAYSQSPEGKNLGFGIIVGDPTGITLKFWTQRTNAIVFDVGGSYFGSPRIDVDYLWHFDAFNSNVAKLYGGLGGVLGIGSGKGFWYKDKGGFYYRTSSDLGLGVRGVFGVNFIPRSTPLELFLEIGALVGLSPSFGSAADFALGVRFYP